MLEEPECGAPGPRGAAAAMDCKDRPAFPVKRLIQARLPFKRLNLVPKGKVEDGSDNMRSSPSASVEGKVPDVEPSLDTLETDCDVDSNLDFRSKLVNGKGPFDNLLRSQLKTSIGQDVVIIDLTEDSNDQPDSAMDHSELNPETSLSREAINGLREEEQEPLTVKAIPKEELACPEETLADISCKTEELACPEETLADISCKTEELACPEETLADISCKTEEEHVGRGGGERTGSSPEGLLQSCPELTRGLRTDPEKEQHSWSEAGGILFKGKVPMVVLQDILAVKPPQARSLSTIPLDRSATSESEVLDSCPEDDCVLSHSSLSSSSPTSSPEGPPAAPQQHRMLSPTPTSTPVCRITKRFVKGSTEKNRMRLQREEKEKLREEARRAREEARRRREEEKELKERERREKREKDEKEKAAKQQLREERRKERREALEAKLEEKRKKEEEKRLREEEKRIKAEKAEITRFFQKPKTPQAPKTLAGSCGKFAPFEIKEHMVLAPRCRAAFNQDLCHQLDQLLQEQSGGSSFLEELKGRQPLVSGPTGVCSRNAGIFNSDVVIVDSSKVGAVPERRKFGRMKLLQFSENHRPAYWGTWNKKTVIIRPRDPWAQDKKLLDYEVDSDEEWEEEEPGESLSHSEGDDDDDVGEDEDEDDGFFVPHGYLSEDEGVTEECTDPEKHRVRQRLKAEEWDELLAKGKRFRVLQPVKIGCVWAAGTADTDPEPDLKVLQQFAVCLLGSAPSEEEPAPRATKASKRERRDQQILAQLLPLLHGNVNGSKVIIREFQEQCRRGLLSPQDAGGPPSPACSRPQTPPAEDATAVPSKARLKRLISENSVYEKRPDFRMCWYVHPHVLTSFAQEHLPVPCQWSYVTMVPTAMATREDGAGAPAGPAPGPPGPLKRKSAGSMCITQFMKKRRHDGQVGAGDTDGFQADTEEEEEDEGDCMIVDVPDGEEAHEPCGTMSEAEGPVGLGTSNSPLPASPLGTS